MKVRFLELLQKNLFVFILLVVTYFLLSLNVVIGYLVILCSIGIFFYFPSYLLTYFVWSVFFQNAFIAFNSSFIDSQESFKILHGTNIVICAFLILISFITTYRYKRSEVNFGINSTTIILILVPFFVIGVLNYGFIPSASYFRLFLTPILLLWAGIVLGKRTSINVLRSTLKVVLFVVLGGTLFQWFFPETAVILYNDVPYYNLKFGWDASPREIVQYFNSNLYLNIDWGLRMMRAVGFMKSFISGSYFIILTSLFVFWEHKKIRVIMIFLTVLVLLASKGAVLTFIFFCLFYLFYTRSNVSMGVILLFHFIALVGLVFLGLSSNNEHLIGFVSGASYLDGLGNGLGFSGNLSPVRLAELGGSPLPDRGYLTRFFNGSESVYGVLFSSLGVFSILYLLSIIFILERIFRRLILSKYYFIGFILVILFFQGIFQEEAYSPYVFGYAMFLGGFVYSNSYLTNKE